MHTSGMPASMVGVEHVIEHLHLLAVLRLRHCLLCFDVSAGRCAVTIGAWIGVATWIRMHPPLQVLAGSQHNYQITASICHLTSADAEYSCSKLTSHLSFHI